MNLYILSTLLLQVYSVAAATCQPVEFLYGLECPVKPTASPTTQNAGCTDKGTVLMVIEKNGGGTMQITNRDTGPRAFAAVFVTNKGGNTVTSFLLKAGEQCNVSLDPQVKRVDRVYTTATRYCGAPINPDPRRCK